MQDKLIEAAQAFIDKLALVEPAINGAFGFQAIHGAHYSGPNYGKELAALKEAIAAVRAHDAGTDEGRIKHIVDRFLQWKLPENFNPDGGISFTKMRNEKSPWPAKNEPVGTNLFDAMQAEEMVRYMLAGIDPASHAAESTPASLNAADQSARNAGCNCSRKIPYLDFSHEKTCPLYSWTCGSSTAQLDAEDPAEPVEDVVAEMIVAFSTHRKGHGERGGMTAALAVAREGYVKLEDALDPPDDTECALANKGNSQPWQDAIREAFRVRRARLAPQPSLAEEIERVLAQTNAFHGQIGESQITSVAAELAALVERRTK